MNDRFGKGPLSYLTGALCGVLWVASPAVAHAGPAETKISWEDVLAAVDNHPAIRATAHTVESARQEVDAAVAVPNPELSGALGVGMAIDGDTSRLEWGVELSIPLEWMGKRRSRKALAGASVNVAEMEGEALRREVLLELRLLFWELLYTQERMAAVEQLVEKAKELLRVVQARVDSGEVRPVEATQVQVEVDKLAVERVLSASQLEVRQAHLGIWLQVADGRTLVAVGEAEVLPVSTGLSRSTEVDWEHPSVRSMEARTQAMVAAVEAEKKERVPAMAVAPFFESELDKRSVGVGLSIELPLWNHNKGAIGKATAELAAHEEAAVLQRLSLRSEAVEARAACEAGTKGVTLYRESVLPGATRILETVQRTYELGEATLWEVLNAGRSLLETQLLFIDMSLQTRMDCSRHASLAGGSI